MTLNQPKLTVSFSGGAYSAAYTGYQGTGQSLNDFLDDVFNAAYVVAASDSTSLVAAWICEDGPQRVSLARTPPTQPWRDYYADFKAQAKSAALDCPPEPDPL